MKLHQNPFPVLFSLHLESFFSSSKKNSHPHSHSLALILTYSFRFSKSTIMSLHPSEPKSQDLPASPKTNAPETHQAPNSQTQVGESSQQIDLEKAEQQPALGSETMTKMLDSIYEKQLIAEAIERRNHCALAHYLVLIRSSAPVLVYDYVYEKCSICVGENVSRNHLCKHEIPDDLSLLDLWMWYKDPAAFGLEVDTKDMELRPWSFDKPTKSYFVPCVSAIQLFEYSKPSGQAQPATAGSLPCSSSEGEVVFEFFENERIKNRLPFWKRIKKLIKRGPSNPERYGDPSKLKTMKLRDIHPASWLAVSWKATSQISSTGKFRANFLTYHSLGYLVHKSVSVGSYLPEIRSCIVAPAFGMEFNNTEGEGWFEERIPDYYIPKELEPFNCINFILEQHVSLREIACFYSTASVFKNGVKVVNKHPDYEYFTSYDKSSLEFLEIVDEDEIEWL